jgi:hypothetical protein
LGEPRGNEYVRRGPLKRRMLRPSSRMPTTRHRAGFETGNHSSSPLPGAITPGAPHVPPKIPEKAARQPATKTKKTGTRKQSPDVCRLTAGQKKMSAHDAEPQCLGLDHASAGGKKKEPRRVVQVVGPQKPSAAERDQCGIAYLDGPSEIGTGSLGT